MQNLSHSTGRLGGAQAYSRKALTSLGTNMSDELVHSEEIGLSSRRRYDVTAYLSPVNRRWIIRYALLMTAVVNLVVNGLLAWLTTIGRSHLGLIGVPLLRAPSLVTDTLGTFVILPITTSLLCSAGVRGYQRRGLLDPTPSASFGPMRWVERLPSGDLRAGFVLAGLSIVLFAPGSCALLVGLTSGGLSRESFVIYKAVLGVALGAVVTPVVAVMAMARGSLRVGAS